MLNLTGVIAHNAHHLANQHLTAVGIEVPAGVQYAIDVDRALADAANPQVDNRLAGDLANRVPVKDLMAHVTADLSAVVAGEHLTGLHRGAQRQLDQIARQAYFDAAGDILEKLAPMFDTVVATYREAANLVGVDTPDSSILARPKLKAIWDEVVAAKARLDAIGAVRTDLADLGYGPRDETPAWYVTNVADLAAAPAGLRQILGDTDITVRLNTAEQIDGLLADAARADQARAAAAQTKRRTPHEARAAQAWDDALTVIRSNGPDAA